MNLSVILAIFLFFGSIASQAQEQVELRLLGRGVYQKQTNEVIALACVDASCEKIQFVRLALEKSSQEMQVEWLGVPLSMPVAPTEELKCEATALLIQNYLSTLELEEKVKRHKVNFDNITYKLSRGMIIALGATALVIGPMTLVTGALLITPVLGTVIFIYAYPSQNLELFLSRSVNPDHVAEVSVNQDGWNWSIKPKKAKRSKFAQLLSNLRNTKHRYLDHDQESIYSKTVSKMKQMEAEGVIFDYSYRCLD
jgi:hypothetical protein